MGFILSVAGLLQLTYLTGTFIVVAFNELDYWGELPGSDVVVLIVTIPINAAALAYLAFRYGRAEWSARLGT